MATRWAKRGAGLCWGGATVFRLETSRAAARPPATATGARQREICMMTCERLPSMSVDVCRRDALRSHLSSCSRHYPPPFPLQPGRHTSSIRVSPAVRCSLDSQKGSRPVRLDNECARPRAAVWGIRHEYEYGYETLMRQIISIKQQLLVRVGTVLYEYE